MKNLINKLIPSVFLLSLPFLPSTAKAQNIDSDSTYCEYIEFSYKNEFYRNLNLFSKKDSSFLYFLIEKHGDKIDTILNINAYIKEIKEIEKISDYNEKMQRADNLLKKASEHFFLGSKVNELFRIRNLFEYKQGGWDVYVSQRNLESEVERTISYLAYRGIKDIENPIQKPDFARGLQSLTEQLQDLSHALENFGKSWQDLTGEAPISQYERNQIMNESARMAEKYSNSRGELTTEGKEYFERQIKYKIIDALEKAADEKEQFDKIKVFAEEMSSLPRIATHPLALILSLNYGYSKHMKEFLQDYREIKLDREQINKKSNQIDFKYEQYSSLLSSWRGAYEGMDAFATLLNSARYNDSWKAKSGDAKDLVAVVNDADERWRIGFIAKKIVRELSNTEEYSQFDRQLKYSGAKADSIVQYITKEVKDFEERGSKGFFAWKNSLEKK